MSDEDELQERLGESVEYEHPKPGDERMGLVPCIRHGLNKCECSETIEVELDLYHTAILYPGLIAEALDLYFKNHPELESASE